jgi:spore coat protein A
MVFRVAAPLQGRDRSRVPDTLNSVPLFSPAQAVATRDLVLSELDSAPPFENPIIAQINGVMWSDPVTETPKAGSVEIWRIVNTTGDAHPIHIHLVQFQILERRHFDINQYPPVVFDLPSATRPRPGQKFRYVYHCHILEHEENEMMRPYDVVG